MTCIVGLTSGGHAWVGGDSAGVAGYSITTRADRKVIRKKSPPMLLGFTTSFRMGDLLRYKLAPPQHPPKMSDDEYMATLFMDEVSRCFSVGGFQEKKNERIEGGTFIIGYKGKIYAVEDDYQLVIPKDCYYAVGCGAEVALGALRGFEVSKAKIPPKKRVQLALEVSEYLNAGVRRPFYIERI